MSKICHALEMDQQNGEHPDLGLQDAFNRTVAEAILSMRLMNLADFMPVSLPITLHREIIARAMDQAADVAFAFVVGTKPCYNKVFGSIRACDKAKIPFFVIDAGQHYDANLIFGQTEFSFTPFIGADLAIRGDLNQKSGELFFKIDRLVKWLKTNWPNKTVIPVVCGDTILCPIVPAAWMFATGEKLAVQIEAGLRSMKPDTYGPPEMISEQSGLNWQLDRSEPWPEQWDTFCAAAGCTLHLAPTELNRDHLIREGYPAEDIRVVGALVSDGLETCMNNPGLSYGMEYLALRNGKWLRIDIHRKENLSRNRLSAIIKAVELLVLDGFNVVFTVMNATDAALNSLGLWENLIRLEAAPNFFTTHVWPSFAQVVEFYQSPDFLAAITDSGGVQEDMNILNKPCMTVRFSTDRPETIINNPGNVLVPPISGNYLYQAIKFHVERRLNDAIPKPVYAMNAGAKIAAALKTYW